MMKLCGTCLFAASIALVSAQDLTKKITYASPAGPASRVIADLAAKTGAPLAVAGNEGSDVIALKVKDTTIQALMDQLAIVTHAEWVPSNGHYYLTRTSQAVDAERKIETDRTEASYRTAIDKKAELAKEMGPFTTSGATTVANQLREYQKAPINQGPNGNGQIWQKIQLAQEKTPAGRAMLRVVSILDPKALVKIPTGIFAAYATNPHASQYALAPGADQILADFVTEQNAWVNVVGDNQAIDEPQGGSYYIEALSNKRRPKLPLRMVVVVGKQPFSNGPSVQMLIAEQSGQVVATQQTNLDDQNQLNIDSMPPQTGPAATELPLQPISKQIRDTFRDLLQGQMNPNIKAGPLPPEVADALTNPVKNDPLSYGTSDALMGLADVKGLNMVACLPDISIGYNFPFSQNDKFTSGLIEMMSAGLGIQLTEKDGFLRMESTTPYTSRTSRVDRSALQALLRSVIKNKRISLDDAAAYALAAPLTQQMDILGIGLAAVIEPSTLSVLEENDWDTLRLYGGMDANQRATLAAKHPISVGSLSNLQRQALDRIVYGNGRGRTYDFYDPNMTEADRLFAFGLGQQPTEAMPNGYSGDAPLTMDTTEDTVVYTVDSTTGRSFEQARAYAPNDIAWQLYQNDHPEVTGGVARPRITFDKVRVATRKQVTIHANLGKFSMIHRSLTDVGVKGDAVDYASLPAAFRANVDRQLKDLTESYKNFRPGSGGGVIPPR